MLSYFKIIEMQSNEDFEKACKAALGSHAVISMNHRIYEMANPQFQMSYSRSGTDVSGYVDSHLKLSTEKSSPMFRVMKDIASLIPSRYIEFDEADPDVKIEISTEKRSPLLSLPLERFCLNHEHLSAMSQYFLPQVEKLYSKGLDKNWEDMANSYLSNFIDKTKLEDRINYIPMNANVYCLLAFAANSNCTALEDFKKNSEQYIAAYKSQVPDILTRDLEFAVF